MSLDRMFVSCFDHIMMSKKRVYLRDICVCDITYLRHDPSFAVSVYRAVMCLISASNDRAMYYANGNPDFVVVIANYGRVLGLVD